MPKAGADKRRILCADGDGRIGALLRPLVNGMALVSAGSGAAALQQAQDQTFDLYIVAERLPDMHGIELCGRIRGFDSHTPILLCGQSGQASEIPLSEAAVQGRIADPVDGVSAARLIRHVLAFARQRSLEARAVAQAAVVGVLTERLRGAVDRPGRMIASSDLLIYDASLMTLAYEAFSAAGGTPGDFKRMWPEVFDEARSAALSRETQT